VFCTDIYCTVTCSGLSSLPEDEPSGSETCIGRKYYQKSMLKLTDLSFVGLCYVIKSEYMAQITSNFKCICKISPVARGPVKGQCAGCLRTEMRHCKF